MKGTRIEPQVTSYLFAKAAGRHIPLSGTFELSPLCNFSCRMCYVHLTGEEVRRSGLRMMTGGEWIRLAREARDQGMLYLLLTGGEPFLYPGFRELYEKLAGMGLILSINTNGALIDAETAAWLRKRPPSRVNITLYGGSPETYEALCGDAGGYEKTRKTIEYLQEAGISVKLNCSLTPYNARDLEKMVRYAESRNLILQAAAYMFPAVRRGKGHTDARDRFTPEETARYLFEIRRLQLGEEAAKQFARSIREGSAPVFSPECGERSPDGTVKCRAGRAAFWITWHGEMRPCGMMEYPGTAVRNKSFEEAWKELTEQTGRIRLSGACSRCGSQKLCHACAASALAETGQFEKTPGYLCQVVRALIKEAAGWADPQTAGIAAQRRGI